MDEAAEHLRRALHALGYTGDPELVDTPERVAALLREFAPTGALEPMSTFPSGGAGPIAIRDIPFHSLCAHHLLPFFGTATVAYAPSGVAAGFGSIARVVEHFARRPQVQERLAEQIADAIHVALAPRGVAVRLVARQLCMEMRGARAGGEAVVLATRGAAEGLLEAVR